MSRAASATAHPPVAPTQVSGLSETVPFTASRAEHPETS